MSLEEMQDQLDRIEAKLDAQAEWRELLMALLKRAFGRLFFAVRELPSVYTQFTPSLQPETIHITVDLTGLTSHEVVVKFLHEYPEYTDKSVVSAGALAKAIKDKFDFEVTRQYAQRIRNEVVEQ